MSGQTKFLNHCRYCHSSTKLRYLSPIHCPTLVHTCRETEGEREGERERERERVCVCVFVCVQALQYLRKVCNHPALVLNPDHPLFSEVQGQLKKTGSTLKDIRHATKLQALK